MFWFADFYRKPDMLAAFPSFIGIPCNVVSFNIFVFYKYSSGVAMLLVTGSWIYTVGTLILLITLVPYTATGKLGIEMAAMVFGACASLAPLQKVAYVLRTGDYKVLPVYLNIVAMAGAIVWSVYAIILEYYEFLIPQIIIMTFCIITFVVYFLLKRRKGKLEAQEIELRNMRSKVRVPKIKIDKELKNNNKGPLTKEDESQIGSESRINDKESGKIVEVKIESPNI